MAASSTLAAADAAGQRLARAARSHCRHFHRTAAVARRDDNPPVDHETRLRSLYDAFNRRDIDATLAGTSADVDWPKIVLARDAMAAAVEGDPLDDLMRFLTTRRGGPIEEEVFVSVPERGYGTRSSTVMVMTETEIVMKERTHPTGEVVTRLSFRATRGIPGSDEQGSHV